jgi:hypothetical protein
MKGNVLKVPPNHFGLAAACLAGIWGVAIKHLGWESTRYPPYLDSRAFFWLAIGLLAISLTHYRFNQDGLLICWLGIPVRKISYRKITGVIWITKTNRRKGLHFPHALVLTLAPYQLTDKVIDSINYRRRNVFHTVFIHLPSWYDEMYFRQLKGYLERFPFRELEYPSIG